MLGRLALVALIASPASAEEPRPVVIGHEWTIHSELLEEDRTIRVRLPRAHAWGKARYPVVYLLDGETNFHHTTATLDTLSRLGHIPELIVVAVDNTDRTRDLTPRREHLPAEDEEDRFPTSGGADRFLDFFEQELIPHVEASYRTAPFRIVIGHSFGGLFTVHALAHRTDLFDAYLVISPSLWWDERQPVADTRALFERRPTLSKRLFVSLAEELEVMRAPYEAFTELLRYDAPPGLDWIARKMDGDDHGTTTIRSTYAGIRSFFTLWRPPSTAEDEGIAGLERHYAQLSESYDFTIPVPERAINVLGQRLLWENQPAEARAVFEENLRRYPESPNAHDSLGEALEASGELDRAVEMFSRAVELAERWDHPSVATYRRHLDDATKSATR